MLFYRRFITAAKDAIHGDDQPAWMSFRRIPRLHFCIIAAVFISLWSFYDYRRTQALWIVNSTSNTVAFHALHLISITTQPLPAMALVTIDSIAKHMPSATVYVHITEEENIPSAIVDERKDVLARQIQFFRWKGLNVNLIFHNDPAADFDGTPLFALPLKQRHLGSYYGVEPHRYLFTHASDLLRAIIMFKYGGIYMDYDIIVLQDPQPLRRIYGPNIFVLFPNDGTLGNCSDTEVTNGWFAVEPNHSVMAQWVGAISDATRNYGPDCVFPWDHSRTISSDCQLEMIGSRAITAIHQKTRANHQPPLRVNEIPNSVESPYATASGKILRSVDVESISTCPRDSADRCWPHENYVVMASQSLTPVRQCPVDDAKFLTEDDSSVIYTSGVLERFAQKVLRMETAYILPVCGLPKWKWLDFAAKGSQYPLLEYVHERNCKHLCSFKTLRRIADGDWSFTSH